MKIDRITHHRQLVGGTYYIRAIIGPIVYRGIEVFRVCGRPFTSKGALPDLRIATAGHYLDNNFLTDMGCEPRPTICHMMDYGAHALLTPFTNKKLAYLKSINDTDDYIRVVSGLDLSDKQIQYIKRKHKYEDQESKELMRRLLVDAYKETRVLPPHAVAGISSLG